MWGHLGTRGREDKSTAPRICNDLPSQDKEFDVQTPSLFLVTGPFSGNVRHFQAIFGKFAWALFGRFQAIPSQGAAKGGRQKEFDHFFSFLGLFRSLFGHFF